MSKEEKLLVIAGFMFATVLFVIPYMKEVLK